MNPHNLSALVLAALACSGATAQHPEGSGPDSRSPPHSPHVPVQCAGLEIVSSGRSIDPIGFRGAQWVQGPPGSEYTLVARNNCSHRVMAILSVDGLNVLTGGLADFRQSGYVLEPGTRARVAGWRKSSSEVAAFFFSSPSVSYAGRTDHPENIGVIGAAFFREKPLPPMEAPAAAENARSDLSLKGAISARSMAPPPGMAPPQSAPSLGTGHGRPIDSRVRQVEFDREDRPFHTLALRYESRLRLEEMGALARPLPVPIEPPRPNPFPAQEPSYVPDPPALPSRR